MAQSLPREILVRAEKRPGDARETGAALEVISRQEVGDSQLETLSEVARYQPNIELFEDYPGSGISAWVIRGVGLQDFNANNTPTAAVFVDEVYQTSAVMGGTPLYDVEQLEIMKGPQGGLYGRNTSGGAVRVNTRRAELGRDDGYLKARYGRWQQLLLEGAQSLDLGQDHALRVAGRRSSAGDGWQRPLGRADRHGEPERWDGRLWYRFKPDDQWQIDWKVASGREDSEAMLARSVGLYDAQGGFCSAVLSGRRDPEECLSFGGLNRVIQGQEPSDLSWQARDGSSVWSDPLNRQSSDYSLSSLHLNADFDDVSLTAISSWTRYDYGVALDLDGDRGEFAHRFSSSDIEVFSQELRLRSASQSPLSWLLGLEWSRESFAETRDFRFGENSLVSSNMGLSKGRVEYDQETRMAAAFGSLSWQLAEQWRLNADLRFTDEDKQYRDGQLYVPGESPQYVLRNLRSDYSLDEQLSGGLSVDWIVSDTLLFYAGVSRGFKSGGFYGGFISSPEELQPYREEVITAWEMGMKGDFFDQRLRIDASAFHYDYEDVQSFVTRINSFTGTPIDVLANPANAVHDGLELDLSWQVSESLRLQAGLAWLDARFVDARESNLDIFGRETLISGRRPYAPEYSASLGLLYTHTLPTGHDLRASVNYDLRSDFGGDQPNVVERTIHHLPGYGVIDGKVDIASISEDWLLSLWVRNLSDKTYRTRVKNDGLRGYAETFGLPRHYGLTLQYSW